MALQTKPLAIGGAALGGIGAVGGGVYVATRPGTIGNKLGSEWLLVTVGNENETEFQELLTKLKGHSNSSVSLTSELEQLKTNNESNAWEKLRDWCEKIYREEYQNETDNLWKLSNLYCKKSSIGEKLEEIKLPENNFDSEWTEKVNKAKQDTNGTQDGKLKGELSNSVENNQKATLISWCKDKYGKPFDTKLNTNPGKKLLDEVRSFCTLTIKEKIGEKNLLSNTSDNKAWKEVQEKKLKTAASSDELEEPFKSLKSRLSANPAKPEIVDTETKDACLSVYEKGYKGESDKLFKNVGKYCSYTIKDNLISGDSVTSDKLFTDTANITSSDSSLSAKMGALSSPTTGIDANLQTKFSEWKTGKDVVNKQKEFRSWCQELYKKQWDGKDKNTDGDYKLAHTHCKKD